MSAASSHEAACNRHFHAIATRSDFCLCLKKKACPLSPIFFLSFLSWIEPPKEIRESHGDSPADNNSTDRILAFVSAPLSIPLSREISGSVAGALRGISRANCRKFYEPLDSCNFCLGSRRMIIEHAGRARYRDALLRNAVMVDVVCARAVFYQCTNNSWTNRVNLARSLLDVCSLRPRDELDQWWQITIRFREDPNWSTNLGIFVIGNSVEKRCDRLRG